MIRAKCGVKLKDQKNTKELMLMLGITVLFERMVRAVAVRWYGHILQREEGNILKEALGNWKEQKGKTKDYLERTVPDISAQQTLRRTFRRNKLGEGQTRHRSNSAQIKLGASQTRLKSNSAQKKMN